MTTMTMTPRRASITDQELLKLEHAFWNAMRDRDVRTASRLTAEDSTVVGATGVMRLDPHSMGNLLESAPYVIKDYRIDPQTVRTTPLCDDVVAVSYRVQEDLEVDGKPVKLEAFDSSVWKKTDDGWACVLHTESIAGDALGRDRMTDRRQ